MLFCSEEFLFLFLPVFLLVYYLAPARNRNLVLFLGSLWFYFRGESAWFLLILVSLTLHYFVTCRMQGKQKQIRRHLLTVLLCYDFGSLFFFKYMPFLIREINMVIANIGESSGTAPALLPELQVTLPLGISFYTFQIASYAIDVYRRPAEYEKKYISLGAYLSMFPQLIAGPIVLFHDIADQMKHRRTSLAGLERGLKLFTIGLGYKMLIANTLGNLWNEIQVVGVESISASMAWLGAVAFSMQIYFDFNGYSVMAIGLGEMLGFRIPRNFRQPYMSCSVTEFWRRWHITLSTWFREYIYIPLGGNRKGVVRTIFNLFVVWSLTGIWHGAGWNFLAWGIYYFVLLAAEKLFLSEFLKQHRWFGRFYTIIAFVSGWVIFALDDLGMAGIYLKKMFFWMGDMGAWTLNAHVTLDALRRYGIFFLAAILLSTGFPENIYRKHKNKIWFMAILLLVFWASVYQMLTAANNPFLYFRF